MRSFAAAAPRAALALRLESASRISAAPAGEGHGNPSARHVQPGCSFYRVARRTGAAFRVFLLCAFLFPALAQAETSASAAPAPAAPAPAAPAPAAPVTPDGPVVVPGDVDQPVLEPIPSARDLFGGHFILGAGVGAKWPFGSFNDAQTQRSELGPGLALNLDLGVGLSRNVALGVWAEFDDFSAPPLCPACSAKSFAGGPFLSYHVAQGTRFDPWGSLAIGVRQSNVDNGGNSQEHFFGAELLRLTLGGAWYATSNFAFGPYVELNMGTYGKLDISTLHTDLGTGLRLVLDLPGK